MKIILKEKVEKLGLLGDTANVKPGYARNYLIPYGKAIKATKNNIAIFDKQKKELEELEINRLKKAREEAKIISDQEIFTVEVVAGDSGKLFGSVGTKEVVKAIEYTSGIKVKKRQIFIPNGTIRSLGEYKISVQLYLGVNTNIKLLVINKKQ